MNKCKLICLTAFTKFVFQTVKVTNLMVILSLVKKLHNIKSTNLALFSLFFYAYYEELSEFRSGIPSDLKKITYIQQ